jgi:protein tyrosine/serine phosphatase
MMEARPQMNPGVSTPQAGRRNMGDSSADQQSLLSDETAPDLSALNLPILKTIKVFIPNLHVIAPGLLRGAQPTPDCLRLLKEAGVKTIINLRNEEILVSQEAWQAKQLGLNYVNVPLDVFTKPTPSAIQQFLAAATNPNNQPVYVHCLHGEDRTGTMCAIYRINQQHWPVDKAYEEMVHYGFKPMLTQLSQCVFEYAQAGNSHAKSTASSVADDMHTRIDKLLGH